VPDENDFGPGTIIGGRYRLGKLGYRYELGNLYFAHDLETERERHVKILGRMPTVETVTRFARECRVLRTLKHENVVNPLDYGDHGVSPFYAIEAIPAERLDVLLKQSAHVPTRVTLDILGQLIDVVATADRHRILHRSLGTKTIRVRNQSGPLDACDSASIFVVDFGLSKILDPGYRENFAVTTNGPPIQYPQYVAPEIIDGEPHTILSEMYSIGAIAYEIVTGTQLFPTATFVSRLSSRSQPLASFHENERRILRPLVDLIMPCLANDPAKRYRDATALRSAFELAERKIPVRKTPPSVALVRQVQLLDLDYYPLAAKQLLADDCQNPDVEAAYHEVEDLHLLAGMTLRLVTAIEAQYKQAKALLEARQASQQKTVSRDCSELTLRVNAMEAIYHQVQAEHEAAKRAILKAKEALKAVMVSFTESGIPILSAEAANMLEVIRKSGR
jgi:serine/threonine protein kinase